MVKKRRNNHRHKVALHAGHGGRKKADRSTVLVIEFPSGRRLETGLPGPGVVLPFLLLLGVFGFGSLFLELSAVDSPYSESGHDRPVMGNDLRSKLVQQLQEMHLQQRLLQQNHMQMHYLINDTTPAGDLCAEDSELPVYSPHRFYPYTCGGVAHAISRYYSFYRSTMQFIPHRFPVDGRDAYITSPFGHRNSVFRGPHGGDEFHRGVDLRASERRIIVAGASGTVERVRFSDRGYGNVVKIKHDSGYSTLYAHLSTIYVKEKEPVFAGQPLGKAGSTGNTTGPHLHYEVIEKSRPVDPGAFIVY